MRVCSARRLAVMWGDMESGEHFTYVDEGCHHVAEGATDCLSRATGRTPADAIIVECIDSEAIEVVEDAQHVAAIEEVDPLDTN